MKKYLSLGFLALMVILGLAYGQTPAFRASMAEDLILEGQVMDLTSDQREALIDLLVSKEGQKNQMGLGQVYTMEMTRKLGKDLVYDVYLDKDYDSLWVYDLKEGLYYLVKGDLARALYMQPQVEDFYSYMQRYYHQLMVDGQPIQTQSTNLLTYQKADGQWQEDREDQAFEPYHIRVDDFLDLQIETGYGMTGVQVNIYQEGDLIHSQQDPDRIYVPEKRGLYDYVVTSTYQGDHYLGQDISSLLVLVDYPPEFSFESSSMVQGETLLMKISRVENLEDLTMTNDYWEVLSIQEAGDDFILVIPSTYYTDLGDYNISITHDGVRYDFPFSVVSRSFNNQYLTVNQETVKATKTEDASAEFRQYYYDALTKDVYETDMTDFKGTFTLPATGRLTTEFGVRRYVNGSLTNYRHAGVDIAAPVESPILSTHHGQVVLSKFLTMTGNTIVISHGQGIFSTYFHLNSLAVEEGDLVEAGDYIGGMGTTGFSTGSHLHFGISYFHMNLEPGYFIFGQPIEYNNYQDLFNQ